jgi:hypothetical protein
VQVGFFYHVLCVDHFLNIGMKPGVLWLVQEESDYLSKGVVGVVLKPSM